MHTRAVLAVLITSSAAAAEPVATVSTVPVSDTGGAIAPEPEPTADQLAAAPAANEGSGVAIAPPHEEHRFANTLLALPRLIARVLLTGPRYAAGHFDNYLANRSPNAFGRDVKSTWRFGAILEYERALGVDVAVRVGREFAPSTAVDAYVGFFGARGQSGGLRASLGSHTDANLEPVLTFDAGRDLDRAFAGIGNRGRVVMYEAETIGGSATLTTSSGWLQAHARGGYDVVRTRDEDGMFAASYNSMLPCFDETHRAATGELSVAYDSRRTSARWIHPAAPSTGWLVRLTGAYSKGRASRSPDFAFPRGTLEVRRLFNLFHGDRVLAIGAVIDAVPEENLPFGRLPSLGGRDRMRAFVRDEVRSRRIGYGDILYEWPLNRSSRGFLFIEGGGTLEEELHAGYGGGIRFLSGTSTSMRIQIAAAETGDVGVFFQLGAL